jgi:hypothetical protein
MSAQQFEHFRNLVDGAYLTLQAVVEAEAAEQAQLRAKLQQQQQQHQQEMLAQQEQHNQEMLAQREQHEQQLQQQREQHQRELAAAVDAAKTAAKTAATNSENARLRAVVGPALLTLQSSERRGRELLAEALQLSVAREEDLASTRLLVFEVLDEPAAARQRLGF